MYKIDYLTSMRLLFFDKYKYGVEILDIPFWSFPPSFGHKRFVSKGYYRVLIIILGAIMIVMTSICIEKRYSNLKEEIRNEILRLEDEN
ncbi:hypothetical protein B6U71_01830 [Euryarchaeota archaeon ex4484_178]|nr:MAG: hypothetical protein B6U71_01830 [Euryarchaeota archaeon ex4484_178]